MKYAHLTGYFSYFSQTGIEQTQNRVLSGDDDLLFVTKLVDLLSGKAGKGGNVQLTIDRAAQDAAYDALEALPGEVQASVVALEPDTGKILAMASLPSYDPNDAGLPRLPRRARRLRRSRRGRGRAAGQPRDPDHAAAGLDLQARDRRRGDRERRLRGDRRRARRRDLPAAADHRQLRPDRQRGPRVRRRQDPVRAGDGQLVQHDLRPARRPARRRELREQAEAFGFNQEYFDDLGPQSVSNFPDRANPPETGQSAIGQFEVQASPLQMAMVAAGIANQGTVMRPYLVDEVQSPTFEVLRQTQPEELSEAVSASTADQLTDLMVHTVEEGTASPAAINGITVAGKTGTAQSGNPDVPPYAWFVSFAPAQDPEVAVAVMIQKIDGVERGEIAGGRLGGPIAKAIMEAVIQ